MLGIDLNSPVTYKTASMRYFEKKEFHVTRFSHYDVLLLVFDGILRFTENGVPHEIRPGQYYIQKSDTFQSATLPSDTPKYFYVHFHAKWADSGRILPLQGNFDYSTCKPVMDALDCYAHNNYTYVEQTSEFLKILSILYRNQQKKEFTLANNIAEFLSAEYLSGITLNQLAEKFNFSKNHIINCFKSEYGLTPFAYINALKLKRAEYLLIVTSDSIENISLSSGFNTYSQFYRLFVEKNGMSPLQWRNLRPL